MHSEISADTAPERFATIRSPWITPAFLILFAGLSVVLIEFHQFLMEHYLDFLNLMSRIEPKFTQGGSLGIRLVVIALAFSFPLFIYGSILHRIKVLVLSLVTSCVVMIVVDIIFLRSMGTPFSFAGAVVATFLGLVAIVVIFY
jgi:hypothetical protein